MKLKPETENSNSKFYLFFFFFFREGRSLPSPTEAEALQVVLFLLHFRRLFGEALFHYPNNKSWNGSSSKFKDFWRFFKTFEDLRRFIKIKLNLISLRFSWFLRQLWFFRVCLLFPLLFRHRQLTKSICVWNFGTLKVGFEVRFSKVQIQVSNVQSPKFKVLKSTRMYFFSS
jgi:hypothetical protein